MFNLHTHCFPEPVIASFPANMSVTEGEEVYLKVEVQGHPSPTLTWYHNGVVVRIDDDREIDKDGGILFPSIGKEHSGIINVFEYT